MTRASADYAIRARDETGDAFRSVKGNLTSTERAFMSFGSVATRAIGAISVAQVTREMATLAREVSRDADQMNKLRIRIGGTTEELSQLRNVADSGGVPFQTMTMGLQRMTRRISEAAQGSGEARGAIRELGIDARKLDQLSPAEQFMALADALQTVGSESGRVRLAMKLFDSEGVALLQTMEGGSAAIRALMQEAAAAGNSISSDMGKTGSAVEDAIRRLDLEFSGIKTQAGGATLEAQRRMADLATSALRGMREDPNRLDVMLGRAGLGDLFDAELNRAKEFWRVLTGGALEAASATEQAEKATASLLDTVRGGADVDPFEAARKRLSQMMPDGPATIDGYEFKGGRLVKSDPLENPIVQDAIAALGRRGGLAEITTPGGNIGQFQTIDRSRFVAGADTQLKPQTVKDPEAVQKLDEIASILRSLGVKFNGDQVARYQ